MKHFFSFALLLALSFTASTTFAQTSFEVPDAVLNTKEDYAKHEADVIAAAKWLEETDLDKERDKRTQVGAFVVKWILGSPTVHVEMNRPLLNLIGKNDALLTIYMASYARHTLENKGADKFASNKAALQSLINVYKKGISIKESKEMEKISKMSDEDLEKYIASKFK